MMGPPRHLGTLAGLLLLASCYDAPRTNPFDPALTPAVELLAVTVDSASGSALLEWTPYAGKQPFAEYRVLRQVRGLVAVDTVAKMTEVRQTSFRDTTPEPEVEYTYWVEVVNQGGFDVESGRQEGVVYALPSIELLQPEFSSDTATAELVWTQYRGPGFAAYEVRRKAPGLDEDMVKELKEVSDTTYTDSLLDGNTEYTYHIVVRTGWEGIGVFSDKRNGKFYPFDRAFNLSEIPDTEPLSVGLAVDDQDQLYIGMTLRSITSRGGQGIVRAGIWVAFPGRDFKPYFEDFLSAPQSPIYLATDPGTVYLSVRLKDGTVLVGAIRKDGEVFWSSLVNTKGVFPVGLYFEENGDVVMVDDLAQLNLLSPEDGLVKKPKPTFLASLQNFPTALPLRQVAVGRGIGLDGDDQFFVLTLNQRDHHLLLRSRLRNGQFRETSFALNPLDEGIGAEQGQTLTPVALAYDPQRIRLLVLEAQGRLQVFDVKPGVKHRYITQWGRPGTGEGEFLVSTANNTAMVVDSQGMVYVADGSERIRIQVFAP